MDSEHVNRANAVCHLPKKGRLLVNPGSDDSWMGQVGDNTGRSWNELTFL